MGMFRGYGVGRALHTMRRLGWQMVRDPGNVRRHVAWSRTLGGEHDLLADDMPFMCYEVADWLRSTLRPDWSVFEWGSGASTLFLGRRVNRVTSVEHHRQWYERLAARLEQEGLSHCELELVPPDEHAGEAAYASEEATCRGQTFERYVKRIDAVADGSLDLVIVDGRARCACVRHALAKVKAGGYVLLDDSDRERYAPALEAMAGQERCEFRGLKPTKKNPVQTTVWRVGVGGG